MKLTINGQDREVSATTVFDLLTELGLHPQGTVVERNREIVDRRPSGTPAWPRATSWSWCAWWGAADESRPMPGLL